MENSNLISLLSTIAAFLSALWAFQSYRVSLRALNVAEKERDAKEGQIQVYLSELYAYDNFVLGSLIYTNASEGPDSVVRIELLIHYLADNVKTNIVVPAVKEQLAIPEAPGLKFTSPPLMLPARGASSIWVAFKVPELPATQNRIDRYEICAQSGSGKTVAISSAVVSEFSYEKVG